MKNWIVFLGLLLAGVLLLVHPAGHRPATVSVPSLTDIELKALLRSPSDASASTSQDAKIMPLQTASFPAAPEASWMAPVPLDLRPADNGDASNQDVTVDEDPNALLRKLRALAVVNFKDAKAAALTLPAGPERDQALEAVCLGLAETRPDKAVQEAMSLQLNERSASVVENLVQQWGAADAPAALAWAEALSPGPEQNQFVMQITFALSKIDPVDAAQVAMQQIPSGATQDEAVMSVLNQWANQDLVAAANWVKIFPAGPLQNRAIDELEGISQYRNSFAAR